VGTTTQSIAAAQGADGSRTSLSTHAATSDRDLPATTLGWARQDSAGRCATTYQTDASEQPRLRRRSIGIDQPCSQAIRWAAWSLRKIP